MGEGWPDLVRDAAPPAAAIELGVHTLRSADGRGCRPALRREQYRPAGRARCVGGGWNSCFLAIATGNCARWSRCCILDRKQGASHVQCARSERCAETKRVALVIESRVRASLAK